MASRTRTRTAVVATAVVLFATAPRRTRCCARQRPKHS